LPACNRLSTKFGDTANRWGWVLEYTSVSGVPLGELGPCNVYAGAGGNNLSAGVKIGTMTFVATGSDHGCSFEPKSGYNYDGVQHCHIAPSWPMAGKKPTGSPGRFRNVGCTVGGPCVLIFHMEASVCPVRRRLLLRGKH
jgi:hypothetical protein